MPRTVSTPLTSSMVPLRSDAPGRTSPCWCSVQQTKATTASGYFPIDRPELSFFRRSSFTNTPDDGGFEELPESRHNYDRSRSTSSASAPTVDFRSSICRFQSAASTRGPSATLKTPRRTR